MSYLNMNKLLNLIKYSKLFISSSKNDHLFIIIYKKTYRKVGKLNSPSSDQTAILLKRAMFYHFLI